MKAALLNTASYELRAPLAVIKGCATTLMRHERRLPRAERQEFLRAICTAIDEIEATADHLAQLAQLESTTLALQWMQVDIAAVTRESIEAIEERYLQQQARLLTFVLYQIGADGGKEQPYYVVKADPYWLRRIVDLLLEHVALRPASGDAIDIVFRTVTWAQLQRACGIGADGSDVGVQTISPHSTEWRSNYLLVTVRQAGTLSLDDCAGPICQRFSGDVASSQREVEELGTGLAVCRRIVELHDGEMYAGASAAAGPGALQVLLPVADEWQSDEPTG